VAFAVDALIALEGRFGNDVMIYLVINRMGRGPAATVIGFMLEVYSICRRFTGSPDGAWQRYSELSSGGNVRVIAGSFICPKAAKAGPEQVLFSPRQIVSGRMYVWHSCLGNNVFHIRGGYLWNPLGNRMN
jgi:hypothetical protein